MKQALSADATYLARFKREARVASDVRHRNLVRHSPSVRIHYDPSPHPPPRSAWHMKDLTGFTDTGVVPA